MLLVEGYTGTKAGFRTDELRRDFADPRIPRFEDVVDEADWNPGREDRIVRLVAEEPQPGKEH
jgi:hypothetical protein